MNVLAQLEKWRELGFITSLETAFVRHLKQLDSEISDDLLLAAAHCIYKQQQGHICTDFSEDEVEYLFEEAQTEIKLDKPLKERWKQSLLKSPLVSDGTELQPLVFEEGRLYLHRFWKYEEELSGWLKKKAAQNCTVSEEEIKVIQSLLKPEGDLFETNWQHIAVVLSFLKDFVVVTGGPGTGKTFTVLNIMAAHLLANPDDPFKIALAAPTGKAARRLINSIEAGITNLPEKIRKKITFPDSALTVHKLLGSDARGSSFRYNEKNKLPYDLLVIDEASMLDINMWVRLVRAISPKTKLVVLGDKDQLASVEAGSILGDICGGENTFSKNISASVNRISGASVPTQESVAPISDCVVFLHKSYRFKEGSGIQKFSIAINENDADGALSVLKDPKYPDVQWLEPNPENMERVIGNYGLQHFKEFKRQPAENRIEASNRKKILCALRKSVFGADGLNRIIERQVHRETGLLQNREWYDGRIVMATRNDNLLKIRNGEIGIYNEKEGKVTFEGESVRKISPARLQHYEPAFAITIHKSQGSEFDEIAIILPNKENTILSKEILYTSVTRARKNTLVIATEQIIRKAIGRTVSRKSGIRNKIWEE